MALQHSTPSCGDIGEPEPAGEPDPDRHYERRVEERGRDD